MKKSKPKHNLYNKKMVLFYIGIGIIGVFAVIFFISAGIKKQANYLSFFYNNISNNVTLTIMTGLHVALLGAGIILVMMSLYNMTPMIKCFDDRFEVNHLFQKTKIIPFSEITSIDTKIFFLKAKNIFRKNEKECRVSFKNNTYNFYLVFDTKGYFDDIEINLDYSHLFSRKCYTEKNTIIDIISEIQKINHSVKTPFLPEEA